MKKYSQSILFCLQLASLQIALMGFYLCSKVFGFDLALSCDTSTVNMASVLITSAGEQRNAVIALLWLRSSLRAISTVW